MIYDTINKFFKIVLYFIIVVIIYLIIKKNYHDNPVRIVYRKQVLFEYRISAILIILIALLLGYYSIICGQYPPISDRGNYAFRFSTHNQNYFLKNSLGMWALVNALYLFSDDIHLLFFSIPFFSFLFIWFGFKKYPENDTTAFLFCGLSLYYVYSFYLFKQAPATAISTISIAYALKKEKVKSIVFAIIAILFHESAIILAPIIVLVIFGKNKLLRYSAYCFLVALMLGFEQITSFLISRFVGSQSSLRYQLRIYLSDTDAIIGESNWLTVLKGFPYYFITVYALIYKKRFSSLISCYDDYLTICLISSASILLSGYMYWMWRFAVYGYFPMFIFSALISRKMRKGERLFFSLILCGSFVIITIRYLYQVYFIRGGF